MSRLNFFRARGARAAAKSDTPLGTTYGKPTPFGETVEKGTPVTPFTNGETAKLGETGTPAAGRPRSRTSFGTFTKKDFIHETAQKTAQTALPIPDDLVEIGQLTRAHGLKGEIALSSNVESTDLLRGDLWVRAGERGPVRLVRIRSFRAHHGQLLLQLEGVSDRTAAELLRGMSVLLAESSLPESDDESIYVRDLLGLRVVLHATGASVGTLEHINFVGEQELWSITDHKGREILFPAVPEFVDDIDLDTEVVRISPPPGLLELYQE